LAKVQSQTTRRQRANNDISECVPFNVPILLYRLTVTFHGHAVNRLLPRNNSKLSVRFAHIVYLTWGTFIFVWLVTATIDRHQAHNQLTVSSPSWRLQL